MKDLKIVKRIGNHIIAVNENGHHYLYDSWCVKNGVIPARLSQCWKYSNTLENIEKYLADVIVFEKHSKDWR